ncbi:MAG: hypothetical protein LBT50_11850 [Prevotellaceae bacterium]|nr:hypothetical protein [Prevotellaceae bacterium]
MKKILLLKKCFSHVIFLACCIVASTLAYVSCTDIYDNVKEYGNEEIVYPAHFDTIYGSIGFERVEIDLCKAGRIPSSKIKLGKAKKTIIEFAKSGRDTTIVIDSICSWVSIRDLTQPNIYRFKIYTADEFGDISVPQEIALIPYTVEDRNALSLPEPSVLSSTTSAQVQWKTSLSSDLYDIYGWSYAYTDRNGDVIRGSGENDAPAFFIENVVRGEPVSVNITTMIIPKIDRIPILDMIEWTFPVTVNISGTKPIIFLDQPYLGVTLTEPPSFSWVKVDEVSDYVLKISSYNTFPDTATTAIPVGDADSYAMTQNEFNALKWMSFYWTVVPATSTDVTTQSRAFWRFINTVANMKENHIEFATIASNTDLDGLSQVTVESLLRPTEAFGTLNTFIGVEGYFLLRFGDSGIDKYQLQVAGRSNYNTPLLLTMNSWHHVAVTYDLPSKTVIVYLNGEEIGRKTDYASSYSNNQMNLGSKLANSTGNKFYIGKSYDDGRHFRGDMSEVRIWNVIRTQEEIAANMYGVSPDAPGLLAYWKLNEGYGKEILDYSSSGLNGVAKSDIAWKEP